MTSIKAGSALCDCDNPDDCTHKIDITLGDKTFSYTQSWFPQALYYVLDVPKTTFTSLNEWPKEEKPNVEIKLSSVSKGCISHNPECPIGNVFNEQGQPVAQFSPENTYKGKLFYDKTEQDFLTLIPGPFMVLKRFLDKDFYEGIEKQHYQVLVDECSNKPLIKETQSGIGKVLSYLRGKRTVLNSNIYLVTQEKIEVDLTFSADKEVDEFTDEERKRQQRKTNREQGLRQRGYRGWRNGTTRYEVRNTYSIEGSVKTQKGGASQIWKKTLLEKEFKKSKNSLKTIDSLKQNIDKFTNFLTAGHPRDKFNILKLDVLYPEVKIHGEYELSHNDDFKLYRKFGAEISASPLFGLSLKLDVLQLIAAAFKINTAVALLREAGEVYEEKVKKGEDGAYAGAELNLITEGDLNVKFGWESDEKGDWAFKKDDLFEVGFGIKAEANIRGGVRYGIINGYVNATATADAKALIGVASNSQNEKVLDLVLYHDGIKAMVNVELAFGVGKQNSPNGTARRQKNKGVKGNAEKEWIFHEPLPKDKSPYRISLG
ncbi:hypothetical protein Xbed_03659 [Xenorhabdus beddingii]|uniref:Uncharacterized protein n=1 Tax=Xenorhabdus beddingii TaxID=40578 RepID=A0A1Y2S7J8_9GAMM|nr:hypothetical protein [Xenorhabdus beddingii]OTA14647.1 hypothetical protein Xbed_03659 [Xenorhabdus beddingii]